MTDKELLTKHLDNVEKRIKWTIQNIKAAYVKGELAEILAEVQEMRRLVDGMPG